MALTKKQKLVMDELFKAEDDESTILVHHNITRGVFNIWLTEASWVQEFERRIEESLRRTQIIITSFQSMAALQLVELTKCKKEATARQACLDIIQMPRIVAEPKIATSVESLKISEEVQESIIELLAKDARKARKKKSDIDKKRS